jgi:uncharacterized protein (TIGR03083 family)
MNHPREILVADRFPALRTKLLDLLAGLSGEDWDRPTAAPQWSVKDVCAHLLGGDVGIISGRRDHFRLPGPPIDDHQQLIAFIDRINAEWVQLARRISPQLLCEFLALTAPAVEECFASLDPMAMNGAVSWAGPEPAPVWFDIAREFTERWHHQQQIRDATGRPPLYDPYFFAPVLDTFVRALPHNFRHIEAPIGTTVRLSVSGEAGGTWFIQSQSDGWLLLLDSRSQLAADVVIPGDAAWRLFTKGLTAEDARSRSIVHGDDSLAGPIFSTVAIIG